MLLFKRFLFVILLLNSFSYAIGQELIIRHNKLLDFLNTLNHSVVLRNEEFNEKGIIKIDKKVPLWVNKISEEIQTKIFGKKIINLNFCIAKSGGTVHMTTHFESANICIYEKNFNKLIQSPDIKNSKGTSLEITRFMIAHEIAHFVQELNIISRKQNFSISGVYSIYKNKLSIVVHKVLGRNVESAQDEKELTDDEIEKYNFINLVLDSNALRGHIEVDYYTYLILLKLRNKIEVDHIRKYFNYIYNLSKSAHTDHELRIKILNAISSCYKYIQVLRYYENVNECLAEEEITYFNNIISYGRKLDSL